MAQHHTPDAKATAVARVLAGESRRKVAAGLGVSDGTVRRWVGKAERRETAQEEKLAEQAAEVVADIEARQREARAVLLERIVALVPDSDSLREVATAYGIVTDKVLLAEGKPTSRSEEVTVSRVERVAGQLDELAARRARRAA